jgi:hypothetical protein
MYRCMNACNWHASLECVFLISHKKSSCEGEKSESSIYIFVGPPESVVYTAERILVKATYSNQLYRPENGMVG